MNNIDPNWSKIMWDVATKVQQYCPGSIRWIAWQIDDGRDDLFGFVIGNGFASVTLERAKNADDALIRELATQILSYPPDSPPDLERRKNEARQTIDQLRQQIKDLQLQQQYWLEQEEDVLGKLAMWEAREG